MALSTRRWLLGAALISSCGGELDPRTTDFEALGEAEAVYALDVSVYTRMISWSELDCLWSEGVRHVIVGTQDPTVAAQQLDFAVDSGMTVDLYVYLYWDTSVTAQVEEALALASGRPIGRLWLDVEEDPDGRSSATMIQLVREGLDACGSFPCGIYTGAGFWISHMGNTDLFSDVPLWYARYELPNNLDDFERERFGGWTSAVAKQYSGSVYVCGTGRWRLNVDENYWLSDAVPTVSVDRTFLPHDTPPPAPARLFPAGGVGLSQQYVKLMAQSIDGASEYQFDVVQWNGAEFRPYYLFTGLTQPTLLQFSMRRDRTYRFRARARNEHGWGAWSDHAQFNLGTVANPPPLPGASVPVDPPPPTGVLATVSPADGARITTTAVRLTCTALDSAQRYEFHIQYRTPGGEFRDYYTYASSSPERTFYPQRSNPTYRWQARALTGTWTEWSPYSTFDFAPP